MNDSNSENNSDIFDHKGNPIKKKVSLIGRLQKLSKKSKVFLISIVAIVAAIASLITNIEKIVNFINPRSINVIPNITLKINNTTSKEVDVLTRSDFFLWFPGNGARHLEGKYALSFINNPEDTLDVISIEPNSSMTVFAKVLNQNLYGKYFTTQEYDISLIVRDTKGNLVFTENLPFTKNDIKKFYLTANLDKK